MTETWDEARLIADGFERVYVELEWYDGPRAGLADVDGELHYFQGHDHDHGDEVDAYRVRPANDAAAKWEREQWASLPRQRLGTAWRMIHQPGSRLPAQSSRRTRWIRCPMS